MIIKNPYRYISKYYKYICLIMLIPLLYLTLKFYDIGKFFRDYVASDYTTFETKIAETYITGLCFGTIFGMLLFNAFISIVFATKKRGSTMHIVIIIYTILLAISAFIFHVVMNSIEARIAEPTLIRVIRDWSNIISIPGFILLPATLATAIGFNFKTFRIERQYDAFIGEDEEGMSDEFELKVGERETTAKGGMVHLIREAKYYVLENKFVFKIIGVILLIIIGISTYMNFQVYNKRYTVNQEFVLNNFTMSLKESYITNVDYRGTLIAKDKYYLAIKLTIQNKSSKVRNIDSANFRIFLGDTEIFPSYDRSSRFIDIGKNYHGENIVGKSINDYVFVYELTEDQLQTQYQMKILTNSVLGDNNKLINSYKIINIKPEYILKTKNLGSAKIGSEITLKETVLGNTTYKLKSLEVADSYPFEYQICDINKVCTTIRDTVVQSGGKTLLIIDDEIKWDQNSSYFKNSDQDFYGDFVKIKYGYSVSYNGEVSDRDEKSILRNKTPAQVTNYKIYEVPAVVKRADYIQLEYSIRNKVFTIDITDIVKGKTG